MASPNTAPIPPAPTSQSYTYPYAASPDMVRSNQKDTYITSVLHTDFSTLLRRLYGTRFTHSYETEARTFIELLYLGLTTFIGNRTLGEEYCGIHQVESRTGKLPAVGRRTGYILSVVLLPYGLGRVLPALRARIRLMLEKRSSRTPKASTSWRVQSYILEHLSALTSTSPVYALTLAAFYFSGSYYHLSKHVFGLRYIFSKKLAPNEQRIGYEVLGVLLVLQMVVQAYLHVQATISTNLPTKGPSSIVDNDVEGDFSAQKSVGVGLNNTAANSKQSIALSTHTPMQISEEPRYNLSVDSTLTWLGPKQQRKCTLCLEPMKDPSVTTCGHVFCWTCILGWVHEKPECPLCRQSILAQHILPLRG